MIMYMYMRNIKVEISSETVRFDVRTSGKSSSTITVMVENIWVESIVRHPELQTK